MLPALTMNDETCESRVADHTAVVNVACSIGQLARGFEPIERIAVAITNTSGHILSWNAGAQALFGYSADELRGASLERLYAREGAGPAQALHELRSGRDGCLRSDGFLIRKDGGRVRVHTILTALGDREAPAAVLSFMCTNENVRWFGSGVPRLDQLVAGVTDYAIFSLDPAGYVTSWNDGARNIKGYEPQEIIGQHFSRFYPADAIERRWPEHELRVATTEGRFEDEGWRVRKDGGTFWANVVITAIRDETGKLLGFCKITRDLTERRRHEEELRLSEQRLRMLMETITDHAIFMLDANGFITSWTPGCERALGYRAEEIMWKHLSNLYRDEDIGASVPWAELAFAAAHGTYKTEAWRQRRNGSAVRAHAVIRAVYDEQGEPCGYAHILTPVESPANTAEYARNAARALRMLLENELRTHLVPLRNAVALLQRRELADPTSSSMLETIHHEAEELASLLQRLLCADGTDPEFPPPNPSLRILPEQPPAE